MELPRGNARYVLGFDEQYIWVGAGDHVACYDLSPELKDDQRLRWRTPLQRSAGRGLLARQSLLVPDGSRVVELDRQDGRILRMFDLSIDGSDPVGNLFTDGERFYVLGMERVTALTDSRYRLAQLDHTIARGDLNARYQRAQIRVLMDAYALAADDLLYILNREQPSSIVHENARSLLVDCLLQLAERDVAQADARLLEVRRWVRGQAQEIRLNITQARLHERMGQYPQAMEIWRELALDDSGLMLPAGTEKDAALAQVAELAGAHLEDLLTRQPELRARLAPLAESALQDAVRANNSVERLLAVARRASSNPGGGPGFVGGSQAQGWGRPC
ncbi:MAG: hypothetical protein HC898_05320 [Phycisphaerales bacterium]|nr:hypothetical protein [Phycisphaerales bacterium]